MKSILLATACLLTLPLMAQNQPVPRPAVRVPTINSQTSTDTPELKENITLRLQGNIATVSDINLSLTGIGPRFAADQMTDDGTALTCQYVVSETDAGYKVSYSISARVKVATQSTPNSTNYEYRDVLISGTVICVVGRPVVLVRNGSKPLQLTIAKEDVNPR